ncbi:MAG TPA: metallophosphoesterase [Fimbriimonadaceae bacterium]|nr:metallophosphoesterase [Fimbriimonadaceae bacterium]
MDSVVLVTMNLRSLAFWTSAASTATLVYGCLVESRRLTLEKVRIPIRDLPQSLVGFKIALLADFHLRDKYSLDLTKRAVGLALDQSPDFVVIAGDFVGYWKPESPWLIGEALEELLLMDGRVVAVPGNHDYWCGDAELLRPILSELNIRLLRNEVYQHSGVSWLGIDSSTKGKADPFSVVQSVEGIKEPKIVVWHEPDSVDWLPRGADLMLSGHSHGGQFTFPWGWTPMHTKGGEKYVRGYYPNAPTPIYVNRGVGTTGPPSRLGCTPEVTLIELVRSE